MYLQLPWQEQTQDTGIAQNPDKLSPTFIAEYRICSISVIPAYAFKAIMQQIT
jgi:hypothetical protein